MEWFRSRSRLVSGFALFALFLQLAVSFGHVHLDAFFPAPDHASAFSMQQSISGDNFLAHPADHELPNQPHDFCPICALVHLSSSSIHPPTPALLLPEAWVRVEFTVDIQFISVELS